MWYVLFKILSAKLGFLTQNKIRKGWDWIHKADEVCSWIINVEIQCCYACHTLYILPSYPGVPITLNNLSNGNCKNKATKSFSGINIQVSSWFSSLKIGQNSHKHKLIKKINNFNHLISNTCSVKTSSTNTLFPQF